MPSLLGQFNVVAEGVALKDDVEEATVDEEFGVTRVDDNEVRKFDTVDDDTLEAAVVEEVLIV